MQYPMMKIIKNNFPLKNTGLADFIFQRIEDVLVVHIPVGNLPPGKAQEVINIYAEMLGKEKEYFKVERMLFLPKRN